MLSISDKVKFTGAATRGVLYKKLFLKKCNIRRKKRLGTTTSKFSATALISNESKLCLLKRKANIKSQFEAWVIFALSGETIERTS